MRYGGALSGFNNAAGIAVGKTGNAYVAGTGQKHASGGDFVTIQYVSGSPSGQFVRGEVNGDGSIDISDAVTILLSLFLGGDDPTCMDAADSNDDGTVDITDAIRVLRYLFLGESPPPDPGPAVCGPDAAPDSLPPCAYPLCP